jgi:prepilin-type N-terminal cleavage/methylation domain-containing protein
MSKGFTLIELALTLIVLSILGTFTFSVVWQYSKIYADTRSGHVYGEAAAVMERLTRELRDAATVDPLSGSPALFINFQTSHGTPSSNAVWVQYCTCSRSQVAGTARVLLYRVDSSQGAADKCGTTCANAPANAMLMTDHIMSSHSDPTAAARQGFRVTCVPGTSTCGTAGPNGDSYEITLALAADRTETNAYDTPPNGSNTNITLVSRVTPRNYTRYDPVKGTGTGTDRSFNGVYYDAIQ